MTISVRDLRIGEMISITADWIGTQKPTFLSIPQIAAHFDRVESVHEALVTARDGASADADLEELTAQAELLDQRHDDLTRALYYLLIAAYHYELGRDSGSQTRADYIERVSSTLFPEQLRAVQASYQAEAGNAAQLDAVATNDFGDLLTQIHIGKDISALDVAHAIGHVGRALGFVENQRSIAAAQAQKEAITPAEIRRRMREWAQVIETILMNFELAGEPTEAVTSLRQPLLDMVEKAILRRREKRAAREKKTDLHD